MKYEGVTSEKMKTFSVFVVFCVLFSKSYAQNNGGCDIPDITDLQWSIRYTNDPIKDTDTLRKVFVANSYIELASAVQNDYLDVNVEGSELIITTNDNFKNYEQSEASSFSEHVITVAIYLNCEVSGESSILNFRQPVTDTNNHYPTFDSDSPYTYELPMPLPSGLSISNYGPTITVEDLDISNTNIYFTIDTDDFTVETEGPVDSLGKQFRAIITATKALRYTENQVFTLTATDSGTDPGPLSSAATINIIVDTENSYPQTPGFTKAYYKGSYDDSEDPIVSIEAISIAEDYESYESLDIYLEGDYSTNFKVTLNERTVVLSLETEISSEVLESETAIVLALYAKEPVEGLTASTVLILELPKKEYVEPPRFTKAYYSSDYTINTESIHDITSEEITLDYENYELIELKLEGDYEAYFDIQRTGQNAVVSVTEKLPDDVLESSFQIILTIVASVDGSEYTGNAALIISLPKDPAEPPSFTKLYYSSSYDVEEGSLQSEAIQIADDYLEYDTLIIALKDDEEYSSYFSVEKNDRNIIVSVRENLPNEVVKEKSYLVFTILAYPEENADLTASTVLIISLPVVEDAETPSFTKPYYGGSYTISDEGIHDISTEQISLTSDLELVNVIVLEEDYKEYFSVDRIDHIVTITLVKDLTEIILQSQSFVVLTIAASTDANPDLIGYTVIVVVLPETEDSTVIGNPTFTNPYYSGNYVISDDEVNVNLEEAITIADNYDYYDLVTVELQEYQEYFSVTRNGRTVNLDVLTKLPESVLSEKSIVLTIVASVEGNSDLVGYAVVIITLPDTENPSDIDNPTFTKPYYSGNYVISDDDDVNVNLEEAITIADNYDYYDLVKVELQEYQEYFSVTRNGRTVDLDVVAKLPESILSGKSIVLTIVASVEENTDLVGYTIVIIALPETENPSDIDNPTFTKPYYSGNYVISDDDVNVNLEEAITIADNYDYYDLVKVELQEYQEYFSVTRNGRTVDLDVVTKLPESILSGQSVVLTIVASVEENTDLVGYTVVIIALPETENPADIDNPTFTKPYYSGNYVISDDDAYVNIEEAITIADNYDYYDLVKVELQEYEEYFSVERNARTVNLQVSTKLPEPILSEQSIVLTIVASVEGNSNLVGYTIVIISLPETEDAPTTDVAPTFTQSYYNGSYSITDNVPQLDVEPISIVSDYNDIELVSVNLQEEEYKTYFSVKREERSIELTLTEVELSEEILENKFIAITIVASVAENSNLKGYTVVIISLPVKEDENPSLVPPSFTKPYYIGTYTISANDDDDNELSVEDIIISENDIESVNVAILEEDYSEYIDLEKSDELVFKFRLKANLPDTLLEDRSVILLTIVASVDEVKATTVAVISIIDNRENNEDPETSIWFEEQVYRFSTNPDRIGTIGVVKAFSDTEENISYSIKDESGIATDVFEIDADTGVITNTENLKEGAIYQLEAHAIGSDSGKETSAEVVINVNIRSEYSAVVRHVTEEEENTNIFLLSDDYKELGFWYEIYEQYPSDGNDYFQINSETGNLECLPIDREAPIISSMYLPQFTVILRLYNNTENNRRKRSLRSEYPSEGRTWVYLEDDLPNVADQTIVFVVVDDINDNPPTFINTKEAIGYPTKELALEILPPYVTVVEATDPDEGYNAAIYFSSSNDEFYVHPTSGVVYPTDELFDDDDKKVTLTVTATDQNGTSGGLSSSITTQVVLLEQDEISVLSVEGLPLEDVDTKLSDLSSQLKLNVGYLSASVVAVSDASRTERASTNFYLRIVAYALDSNNEPVTGDTLEDYIKDLELDDSWSVQSWESYTKETYKITKASSTGLLVAVIILAILLFIFLAGVAGTVYYLKYKRPSYATMIEDRDSPTDFKKEPRLEETTPSHFTGFVKKQTATTATKVSTIEDVPPRRPTGHSLYVNGETGQDDETADTSTEASTTLSNEQETETPRERKKSVAFNENVERLELENEEIQSTDL